MGKGREGIGSVEAAQTETTAFRSFCNHLLDASLCTPGGGKFHGSTGDTLEYIVKQSNVTVDNLRNVSDYLSAAKSVLEWFAFLGSRCPDQRLM
ncbi:hypothetical protein IFM89_032032 [Coptis chinensis]|uniref:Uncharacterized protein n=1 Tax=Coptis chinensis TaxID=261450 RepID=A0A835H0S4_9MAGN|nr:hypothetical protein IFM89_032032 [Coptis chinensis]